MISDGSSAPEDQSGGGYNGVHVDLHRLRLRLQEILTSIRAFESAIQLPPVLDVSLVGEDPSRVGGIGSGETTIPGLRGLEESVRRDLDVLAKFLDDPKSEELPPLSTNAPYLVAVWEEVLAAPPPVVGIWSSFPDPGGRSTRGDDVRKSKKKRKAQDVKVDIVANGGLSWIRVNTIKNSKILSEFREIDSYLTDSDPEDDDDELGAAQCPTRPSPNEDELENSVIRMGRSLISAARHANPSIPTLRSTAKPTTATTLSTSHNPTPRIRITFRLTRLDPSPSDPSHFDPRIPQTIRTLENMGIQVKLGESDPHSPPPLSPPRVFLPTIQVNLDLSLLVALISDITHLPLPTSHEDAEDRFIPPPSYVEWKTRRMEEVILQESLEDDLDENGSGTDSGSKKKKVKLPGQGRPETGKHSRALANQAKQEMKSAILEEMHDRLLQTVRFVHGNDLSLKDVEFWTTAEARARCLRIASKISGTRERERAKALLFSPTLTATASPEDGGGPEERLKAASALYWDNSRYEERYLPLLPVRIFPQSPDEVPSFYHKSSPLPRSPFFNRLVKTCTHILAQNIVPHPRSLPSNIVSTRPVPSPLDTNSSSGMDALELEGLSLLGDDRGEIQRATVTKANPKLTAHTVESLLEGARRGWTTLTANKHSVKEILKEVKTFSGGYYAAGISVHESDEAHENVRVMMDGGGNAIETAAIWVVDPRSLAEVMSADYVPPPPAPEDRGRPP
ncbi:hypothetical protein BJ322DRAFT_267761 [Thelephora terrestris]|uniref:Uncharacterized protein n=1 Tax=Thelephora terrestris TaxID=56493 RepID=A0A9P6H9W2_9AGAM|nr:hypothetical protein BJ322DRAFT_267761 [Thelephora terrestris]